MKCKDCPSVVTDFMTCFDGRGMIEISYCDFEETVGRMVDPDVERECDKFPVKEKTLEVQNASR